MVQWGIAARDLEKMLTKTFEMRRFYLASADWGWDGREAKINSWGCYGGWGWCLARGRSELYRWFFWDEETWLEVD
jgi:hypothetical protein